MSIRHASKSVVDGLSLSRPSNYICRQCRRNAHPSSIAIQIRHFASERPGNIPFAERVRRKLWKGKPPGPENVDDLYGGPGALETMYKERQQRKAQAKASEQSADQPTTVPEESTSSTQSMQQTKSPQMQKSASKKTGLAPAKRTEPKQSSAVTRQDGRRLKEDEDGDDFREATSWEGLPVIGSTGHWKEEPAYLRDEYFSWLESPVRPDWTYPQLVSLMHQALTETFAYQRTSNGYLQVCRLNAGSPYTVHELSRATITISTDGYLTDVKDIIEIDNLEKGAVYSKRKQRAKRRGEYGISEGVAVIARTKPIMTPIMPRLLYTPNDTSFLNATLSISSGGHELTSTILKRFSYLINHPIPDPILSTLFTTPPPNNTLHHFLTLLATTTTKAKPATVAESLLNNETLAGQPNLLVLGRRETPVDREKEVGRWKVIEGELKARGLPVLGRLVVQR